MNYVPGNTPLVRLENLEKFFGVSCKLFAKYEAKNPTGSIKDRPVYFMLQKYIENGELVKGGTVIEATSGNTGISLAFYSKYFDYHCIIVMPESASKERREIIGSYGAELVLVKGGMKECNEKAEELKNLYKNAIIFSQFDNLNNYTSHYETTGPEIAKDIDKIDYFVAGFGTGGTLSGSGKYLKEKLNTKIIGVEPLESPLVTKNEAHPHLIQGIGANFIPANFRKEFVDEIIDVNGEGSIEYARCIRKLENLDVGISSGAALLGAIELIKNNEIKEGNVVMIFPDKGDRYSW